ncbi:lipid A deacylase LpxR family protein [Sabulicella glaciei]|uniref:Lipid A deacylase LpxR family protein n=1 Tax=Sabulicella glaciei TaxID=2984948 RepID=A0ABT3P0F3_9PROT|nr:lipid A deacylase LpxR family protein [Roseococcus sp. MDT2-1-1]MCW8087887.1 lipid A deacylase LpxR family protein [Roseococcus sp. MDT2-1-1]
MIRIHAPGLALALSLLALPAAAQTPAAELPVRPLPPDPRGTLTLTTENDLFGGLTDRYYSNGLLLTWRSPSTELPSPLAWLDQRLTWLFGPGNLRWGVSLGQNIYTPEDKRRYIPDPRDRPYAGHLYATVSLSRSTERTQTLLELQAGMVGPSALGEQVQNNYHRLINVKRLNGWEYQLKDEPTLNAMLERRWRIPMGRIGSLDTELIPSATAALGNVAINAGGGAVFRIGQGLEADWGPTRIRPSPAGSSFFQPTRDFGWYLFAGVDGRVVARDIFLDGSTFRENSPSVHRRWLVGEATAGAAIYWRGTRIAYTQVVRSEEFYGQRGTQIFGSISVSFRF